MRLTTLTKSIHKIDVTHQFPDLTIFSAGSYARLDASEHSDIDLFFISRSPLNTVEDPHTKELRLFGKLIEAVDEMNFPKFSNDAQYLELTEAHEIVDNLGSPTDDHKNYFTIRMLLLLESKCLYGEEAYLAVIGDMVKSYFKDFPDHQASFEPIFLINDIARFWKTLLLNYEHRRRPGDDEALKVKQKVKNFKLKYSRMITCFAMIAALGSYEAPIRQDQVVHEVNLTPRERLLGVADRVPETAEFVEKVLVEYAWFLQMTGLETDKLHGYFRDKESRVKMFDRAKEFGATVFSLLAALDAAQTKKDRPLLRYLVI